MLIFTKPSKMPSKMQDMKHFFALSATLQDFSHEHSHLFCNRDQNETWGFRSQTTGGQCQSFTRFGCNETARFRQEGPLAVGCAESTVPYSLLCHQINNCKVMHSSTLCQVQTLAPTNKVLWRPPYDSKCLFETRLQMFMWCWSACCLHVK